MSSFSPRLPPKTGSINALLTALTTDADLAARLAHVRRDDGRSADDTRLPDGLPEPLVHALASQGKERLWGHQREAIAHSLEGRNVVIATETSSGKSLCFQVPVLQSTMRDPQARALFLFPTNPLANDQEVALRDLLGRLPESVRPRAPVRLHGAMGTRKDEIARSEPQLVLTNPEMVHLHLLPQHKRWASFWRGLEWIVVDEIHLYRGAFGGHVANLLRRIRRCAWRYGAAPKIIAASATVGNPKALAETLCSAPFELVDRSSAPRGPRTTVLWRPEDHYLDESVDVFRRALDANLQAILFARSRQTVESLVTKLEAATGRTRVGLGVRAYRGGYRREEREVIERGLRDGTVRGVVTTNALEVGVDIGSLDVCVIAGWPGSVMAMRQQAGRVGRRDRESAVFLVASENPLDRWLLAHPEELEIAQSERAVVGRLNGNILRSHLACASKEFPLWEAEIERLGGDVARREVSALVSKNEARWGADGARRALWGAGYPHARVSLRSANNERLTLIDPDGERIGEIDGDSVVREAHVGAIYVHQGRSFRVEGNEGGLVRLSVAPPGSSTRVLGERTAVVLAESERRVLVPGLEVGFATSLRITDTYTEFLETPGARRRAFTRTLEPPVCAELVTEGLVLHVDASVEPRVGHALEHALHGAEHVLTALASSAVLCDRNDLEGHSQTHDGSGFLVLFDRAPGGMGFAREAFSLIEALVRRAGESIETCECEAGCPECIHSGRCLTGNKDLSKDGARRFLALARGDSPDAFTPPVVRVRTSRELASVVRRPSGKTPRKAESDGEFSPGDRVEHAVFGAGTVLEVRPSGRVVVDFGDEKPRRITPGWLTRSA